MLPKLTEVTPVNPVPVIAILVPPVAGPLVCEIEVTAGAIANATVQEAVTVVPSLLYNVSVVSWLPPVTV